jgi:hypothetical protein
MAPIPAFQTYGNYSSKNYGAHCLQFFDAAGNVFWFSYSTLVAFKPCGGPLIVRENDWGPTTGKHLNAIDGGGGAKKARLPAAAFQRELGRAFDSAAIAAE